MSKRLSIGRFWKRTSAATAIEYGLIASLIAIGVITGATQTGEETKKPFEKIGTAMQTSNDNN
ncbi:MAG: Flp family type IVb pilin [Pseudomonadota bacterium]